MDAIQVLGAYPIIGIAAFLLQYLDVTLAGIKWIISKLKLSPKAVALDLAIELHKKSNTKAFGTK